MPLISPVYRTSRSSVLTPDREEREILALLALAGDQYDNHTRVVWNEDTHPHLVSTTRFNAMKLAMKFMALDAFVPRKRRCAIMEQLFNFAEQLWKHIVAHGPALIHYLGDANDYEISHIWSVFVACPRVNPPFTTTMCPAGNRLTISRNSLYKNALGPAVKALGQPNYVPFCQIDKEVLHSEEPALPTAQHTRLARKRRFSLCDITVEEVPTLRTQAMCDEIFAREDDMEVGEDIAFEDRPQPRYVTYCREAGETAQKRWACSLSLRNAQTNLGPCEEDSVHAECREAVWREKRGYSLSYVDLIDERKRETEFTPIHTAALIKRSRLI